MDKRGVPWGPTGVCLVGVCLHFGRSSFGLHASAVATGAIDISLPLYAGWIYSDGAVITYAFVVMISGSLVGLQVYRRAGMRIGGYKAPLGIPDIELLSGGVIRASGARVADKAGALTLSAIGTACSHGTSASQQKRAGCWIGTCTSDRVAIPALSVPLCGVYWPSRKIEVAV